MSINEIKITKDENGWFYIKSSNSTICTTKLSEVLNWVKHILECENKIPSNIGRKIGRKI